MAAVERDAATRERDLALAMYETFLASGSEDSISPRFQSREARDCSPQGLKSLKDNRSSSSSKELNEACLLNLRLTEFSHHERGAARLNHGSFGSCPKSVLAVQEEWTQRWLKQPDEFYFDGLEVGLLEARKAVAEHVNCPVEELVLVDNATVSSSIVAMDVMWALAEGRYKKGDMILMLNFAYRAVANAFQAYGVRAGAQLLIVDIPFPVRSPVEVLAALEKVLQKAKSEEKVIRLAVLDHIVSMPSIILPVKEMVAMCRRYGIEQVFVDGAQAIGQVDINVKDIDADYYTSNLNKWLFAPTTASLFHSKAKHLARLHHPITSHNYGKGLVDECSWVGTRDYSPLLAVPACFKFIDRVPGGLKAIKAYNHDRIVAVGQMLADAWATHCGVAPEMMGTMVMVGLPPALHISSSQELQSLRIRLRQEFSIEVYGFVPKTTPDEGFSAYLRVSHQLYNTWDDYLRLRDAINLLVAEQSIGKANITEEEGSGELLNLFAALRTLEDRGVRDRLQFVSSSARKRLSGFVEFEIASSEFIVSNENRVDEVQVNIAFIVPVAVGYLATRKRGVVILPYAWKKLIVRVWGFLRLFRCSCVGEDHEMILRVKIGGPAGVLQRYQRILRYYTTTNGPEEKRSSVPRRTIAASASAYEVLGLSEKCSPASIRIAFKKLAKATHPDLQSESSTVEFIRVLAAYEILSDPQKRAQYDENLRSRRAEQTTADASHFEEKSHVRSREELELADKSTEVVSWLKTYRVMVKDIIRRQEIGAGSGWEEELRAETQSALRKAYFGPPVSEREGVPECFEAEERAQPDLLDVLHLVSGRHLFGLVRQVDVPLLESAAGQRPALLHTNPHALESNPDRFDPARTVERREIHTEESQGLQQAEGSPSSCSLRDDSQSVFVDLELEMFGNVVARSIRVPPEERCSDSDSSGSGKEEDEGDSIYVYLSSEQIEDNELMENASGQELKKIFLGSIRGLGSSKVGSVCNVYGPDGQRTHLILQHRTPGVKHMQWFRIGEDGSPCECRCRRASVLPSRYWIFEPRADTHNVGGWYIETFGHSSRRRMNKRVSYESREYKHGFSIYSATRDDKKLHPAMYIMAAAYKTLDEEVGQRRRGALSTRLRAWSGLDQISSSFSTWWRSRWSL
ncbi:hypothetical protein R1sor_024256 [Riccia sorocarpa]|uniref:J domain-containing protein n=1 Tax=Riccia sorocarpa TaxID=122646 RepID=A0ABD3GQ00_9MARC